MPSFTKLPSGRWRVQIRRQGKSASKTFRLKSDADRWATEQEDRAGVRPGVPPLDRLLEQELPDHGCEHLYRPSVAADPGDEE